MNKNNFHRSGIQKMFVQNIGVTIKPKTIENTSAELSKLYISMDDVSNFIKLYIMVKREE
jgi:hypothetical protein